MQRGPRCVFHRRRLRYDQGFRLELGYCFDHGIPHTQFLAWPAEDRAKMVSYAMEKSLRCTMCGTADWEWDDEEGDGRFAYAAVHEVCHGCQQKDLAREEDSETGSKPGVSVTLIPRAAAQALVMQQEARR